MTLSQGIVSRPLIAALLVGAGGLLQAESAWACRSNEECKSPRICEMGTCVNPPPATAARCERDIDCGGADVCENNRCVPMMSTTPGEDQLTPPTTVNPPPGQESEPPGLQITPHKAEPSPAPAAEPEPPAQPPPPPPRTPPPPRQRTQRPPPDARIEAPPDEPPPAPPPPYHGRHRKPLLSPRFDLFAGGGLLFLETPLYSSTALGIGLDGQFLIGVAPSVALGIRAGGVLVLEPNHLDLSMGYVAPGIVVPEWHSGLFIGAATARGPYEKRLGGVQFEVPCEYELMPFLKIGVVLGLGIFPASSTLYERTLRFEIGF